MTDIRETVLNDLSVMRFPGDEIDADALEGITYCAYCYYREERCICNYDDLTDDEGDEEAHVVYEIPECPKCLLSEKVHCCECGEYFLECTCVSDEWYCMGCMDTFTFDPIYSIDDSEADVVEEDGFIYVETTDGTVIGYDSDGVGYFANGELQGQEVTCHCKPSKQYCCATCNVRREKPNEVWTYWDKNKSPTDPTSWKKSGVGPSENKGTKYHKYNIGNVGTYGTYGDWDDYDDWGSYQICRHYDFELKLNNVTVWPSSLASDKKRDKYPDFGLYADWTWHPWWRNEHIDWPDYGIPTNYEVAASQITDAFQLAKAGKRVEIGCIGGHGRTGTILACMAVLDGMTVRQAINHVRTKYCHSTIETASQKWWIKWFYSHVNDLPYPPQPEFKSLSAQHGVCSNREHWEMWEKGLKECETGKDCKFWKIDTDKFSKGGVTYTTGSTAPGAKKPKEDYFVIDGYKIPKPKRGFPLHEINAKRGCKCDYCRYKAMRPKGIGEAFLEPLYPPNPPSTTLPEPAGSATPKLDQLALPVGNDEEVLGEGEEWINVAVGGGRLMRIKAKKGELDLTSKSNDDTVEVPVVKPEHLSDEFAKTESGYEWKGVLRDGINKRNKRNKKKSKKRNRNNYVNSKR